MRLGVITLGHVHAEELNALTPHLQHLEQLVLDVPFDDPLSKHRAELNRAVDAARDDWLLIVREREIVDDAIAREITDAMRAQNAWGFRIRSIPMYAGKPLRIGVTDGELRLFHRRHLLRRGELGVQGTVVRLNNVLRSMSFDTAAAHREYLEKNGVPHSLLRRLLLFVHHAIVTRAHDANTLHYLWIEAGYDLKMAELDESQKAFRKLVNHTFWAALAFVAIILIAVGLDEFVHFLRWARAVTADSPLEWAILTAKYGLLAIDVVLLVGVVAKLAWRAWRSL